MITVTLQVIVILMLVAFITGVMVGVTLSRPITLDGPLSKADKNESNNQDEHE
jgi:hypothetical protein